MSRELPWQGPKQLKNVSPTDESTAVKQRESIWLQIKNALVAAGTGAWSVVWSSNGVNNTASAADNWAAIGDINCDIGASGKFSSIELASPDGKAHLVISFEAGLNNLDGVKVVLGGAAFSAGSTSAAPTLATAQKFNSGNSYTYIKAAASFVSSKICFARSDSGDWWASIVEVGSGVLQTLLRCHKLLNPKSGDGYNWMFQIVYTSSGIVDGDMLSAAAKAAMVWTDGAFAGSSQTADPGVQMWTYAIPSIAAVHGSVIKNGEGSIDSTGILLPCLVTQAPATNAAKFDHRGRPPDFLMGPSGSGTGNDRVYPKSPAPVEYVRLGASSFYAPLDTAINY